MKKLLSLLFVVLLSLSVIACNNTTPDTNDGAGNPQNEPFDLNKITFASAYAKAQNLGFEGTLEEFVELISGKDGKDGKDGVGITSVTVDNIGNLLVVLSNGKTINCGKVTGKDGTDGKTPYIENGYWYIDGVNTGIKAEGVDGKDAISIKEIVLDDEGRMVITLTDGTVLDPIELPNSAGHIHNFGEWINYSENSNTNCENRLYYHICSECNAIEWQKGFYENHKFTTITVTPTCVAQGYDESTCSVCGFVEKTNYTAIADHTVQSSGYCAVCNQPVASTEGILYEISEDETYAEVVGYTGTATNVVIADIYNGVPVTGIRTRAFYENTTITSVVIPDSITYIGFVAFPYCPNLESVTIGNSVTMIDERAFYDCDNLKSVTIPDSVTNIGYAAFADCISLVSVTIGDGVVSIADNAFSRCSNLTSAIIPDNVTSLGAFVFYECKNLTNVIIGNGVKSVGEKAFYLCSNLATVTIGNSVNSIGDSAFYYCSSLTNITIPDSVTSIGDSAFSSCSNLTSVTIGNNVKSIGINAFYYCNSALYTEYGYGKYIGNKDNPYAVLIEITNKNLEAYTINENTTFIGYGAFENCKNLISISIPNNVTCIGDNAFENCTGLTNVTIPDSVTNINDGAFRSCTSLTSITIPNSVTNIDGWAFYWCTSLERVNISDMVAWCNISFGHEYANPLSFAKKLYLNGKLVTEVVIPEGITSIGNYSFYYCQSITNVIIPNSVKSIGDYAFYKCIGLPSITIPDSVTSIGDSAFSDCDGLTSITIPDSVEFIGYAALYCSNLKTVYYTGSKEEWKNILIGMYNEKLTGATIHYNYVPEEE